MSSHTDNATIHVVEGFHCDPVWVSNQHRYNLVSMDNVRQLIDACVADPGYRAFIHELDYVRSFVDEYPEYRDLLFQLVEDGRIAVGSSYNQPNENNCSGEALVRNILYGDGYLRGFLGGNPGIYHAWDVFGHIPQLSQLVAKSGLNGALWCKHIHGFPPIFNHMALDGTILPHMRTSYSWSSDSLGNLLQRTDANLAEKASLGLHRHLVVDAKDFHSPSAWMVGQTKDMAKTSPRVVMTSPEEFLDEILADTERHGVSLPLTSRNPSQYHIGTFMSRPEMKIANRLCENTLIAAETWSTFASLMGAQYPDIALDRAWRQVLFGQHHDAITGTPCDMSYLDLMAGYREALDLADAVHSNATGFIANAVQAPASGRPVVVFNSLNRSRGGLVSVPVDGNVEVHAEDGTMLPSLITDGTLEFIADDIPSTGYATVTLVPADEVEEVEITDTPVLQNDYWTLTLDPSKGGAITSLLDRETGRDYAPEVSNDLLSLHERGGRKEASWEMWTTGRRAFASQDHAEVSVQTTPIGQTAIITGSIGEICTYRRTLTVRPGQRMIEASVEITGYTSEDDLFAVRFNPGIEGALPVFEDRFGSMVARRGRLPLDYRTQGHHRHSDCAVFPVYNWIDAGGSARIQTGDSALSLGMTGLILPHDTDISEQTESLMRVLAHQGITATPYFDDDDLPRIEAMHASTSSTEFDGTERPRGDDISMCAQWITVSVDGNNAYAESLLSRLGDNARAVMGGQISTQGWGMIIAEDGDVPEQWPIMPVLLICASDSDALARAVATMAEQFTANGTVSLPPECDLRTDGQPIDTHGLALLSPGNGSATMDPDGSLVLFLTQTAHWASNLLDDTLIPEHRDMAFHYGILPHEGSWREAGVVEAGYAFNNPLTAAVPEGNGGSLPSSQSFLAFDAPGAVVTAIKPAGNPVSEMSSWRSDPSDGIIVRAYESQGRQATGTITLASGITGASATDLMERDVSTLALNDGTLPATLDPFSVETVRLDAREWPVCGSGSLEPDLSQAIPTWCRHWQHNDGAHAVGNQPVGIYINGDIPRTNDGGQFPTVNRLQVTIVNDTVDHTISGTASLIAPDTWNVIPRDIEYEIPPRGHLSVPVTVSMENLTPGMIKARMEYSGRGYQDVLEVGSGFKRTVSGNAMTITKTIEPAWNATRDGDDVVVEVTNPWDQPLEAEVTLVTPVETWASAGAHALADISPRNHALALDAGETRTMRFTMTVDYDAPAFWAWVRLTCNGVPDYRKV
jgi:alpha-mannosidase